MNIFLYLFRNLYWPTLVKLVHFISSQFTAGNSTDFSFWFSFSSCPVSFSFPPCPLWPSLFFLSLPPPQTTPTLFIQLQGRNTPNAARPRGTAHTSHTRWPVQITAAVTVGALYSHDDTDWFRSCTWLFSVKSLKLWTATRTCCDWVVMMLGSIWISLHFCHSFLTVLWFCEEMERTQLHSCTLQQCRWEKA